MALDQNFWASRYEEEKTGWDIGGPSRPLVEYLDGLKDKEIRILFPGAGFAYDAEYAFKIGFKNVYVSDLVQETKDSFLERIPIFPKEQFLVGDFFTIEKEFDLIMEQTFYCALPPALRDDYVSKMHDILSVGGKLAGVLFTFPLTEQGPPFGGGKDEYQERFSKLFKINLLEDCKNSIESRMGNEVFIEIEK